MSQKRFPENEFQWPSSIEAAMRNHVKNAVARLSPERYEQEPAYVAALIARLDGLVYKAPYARVEIIGTIVNDRGPNSAESRTGADFAITARLTDNARTVSKAVLGQAKRGAIETLTNSEGDRLEKQCDRMKRHTDSCIILETPVASKHSDSSPMVHIHGEDSKEKYTLADYLVDRLMACSHGDCDQDFVIKASNSRLNGIHMEASIFGF